MIKEIAYIEEPKLIFGNGQETHDPRDGLILYGPYEKWGKLGDFNNYTISVGLIGEKATLEAYENFVQEMKKPIISEKRNMQGEIVSNELQRPSFLGFETIFNIRWPEKPETFIEIKKVEIEKIFTNYKYKQQRTSELVDLYLSKILEFTTDYDERVDIWFIIVSKKIYENCRTIKGSGKEFSKKIIKNLKDKTQGSLFSEEEMYGSEISKYLDDSSDFHHLLKARANQEKLPTPTQIIVEPKLSFKPIESNFPLKGDMKAFFAWNLCSTLYYKLGKKPWKLSGIREGVCYLGLVFKKIQSKSDEKNVCSAAQLFMDDGDGTIFRGNNGLWFTESIKEFHLDEQEAYNLLNLALKDYHKNNNETYPKELFIHGRATFSDEEWAGFINAVKKHNAETNLVGIVIKEGMSLKFFREVTNDTSDYGVLRGLSAIINEQEAYLFTKGFVPRLNTSLSLETPNPLHIKITRGECDIKTVLKDVMALTKINYNSCVYGDGKPVTLRFSDNIGSILTATSNTQQENRQFRFYI